MKLVITQRFLFVVVHVANRPNRPCRIVEKSPREEHTRIDRIDREKQLMRSRCSTISA